PLLLLGAGLAAAQSPTSAPRLQVAVEVVSADQSGLTLTVRQSGRFNVSTSNLPEDTSIVTLPVQAGAAPSLRSVRSGGEVTITCFAGAAPAPRPTAAPTAARPGPSPAGTAMVVKPLMNLQGHCEVVAIGPAARAPSGQ